MNPTKRSHELHEDCSWYGAECWSSCRPYRAARDRVSLEGLTRPFPTRPRDRLSRRTMTDEQHIWVIDSLEEDVATIEEDGQHLRRVSLWMLPAGVREGDTLLITRRAKVGGEVHLQLVVHREAALPGRDEARTRPRSASDPGGDIVL